MLDNKKARRRQNSNVKYLDALQANHSKICTVRVDLSYKKPYSEEITLEEAKKLYNSSEEAKTFLLSKFTKDELEGKNIPTQDEFNKFFEENIFPLIDYSKTRFLTSNGYLSQTPTSRIELNNSNDK